VRLKPLIHLSEERILTLRIISLSEWQKFGGEGGIVGRSGVVAPALLPERALSCKGLDAWLKVFGIANFKRHDALDDAFASGTVAASAAASRGNAGPAQRRRAARNGVFVGMVARQNK
jgi:DNA polymerase III epsilon subunit-like protein